MKPRKVKRLEPAGPLHDNALRIVRTRVDELYSFDPHGDAQTLHDMRIAAKRLRYILELTSPVLGAAAATGARHAKQIQTLLGDLHDCDVMLALIDEHQAKLRRADANAAIAVASRGAKDLTPDALHTLPCKPHYSGLEALRAYFSARRELLHRRFLEKWQRLTSDGFRERFLTAPDRNSG